MRGDGVGRTKGRRHFRIVFRKDVSAKSWWQEDHKVGDLHTSLRIPHGPVTNLIAHQAVRAMRGGKAGASIVQARVPEFQAVYCLMVKKRGWVIGIMGGDNEQDKLCKMVEEAGKDSTRVRSGVTLNIVGNKARDQVAVKGKKEFLEVQNQACPWVGEGKLRQGCVVRRRESARELPGIDVYGLE